MTASSNGRLWLRDGTDEVAEPDALIRWYDASVRYGPTYYRVASATPRDVVGLEDLGHAVLFAGRPSALAARSLVEHPVNISLVPEQPLSELDAHGVARVVDAVMDLVAMPGFGSAVATKVLHKKRPASVPVLDNKAIFGTYMIRTWRRGRDAWPRRSVPVKDRKQIAAAVTAIAADVVAEENTAGWNALETAFPSLTRIELFDKLWWALVHSAQSSTLATKP